MIDLDAIPIYLAYRGRRGGLRFVRADRLVATTGHLAEVVRAATLQDASRVFAEAFRGDLTAALRVDPS